MRRARRISLVVGIVLGITWSIWRAPHLADDIRYALTPSWSGIELALADDGTVAVDGRRMRVEGGMGVDCMPAVALFIIPSPPCRGPGMSALIVATGPARPLPRLVHARVESEGQTWVTDLIDRPDLAYYDATFDLQYASADSQREKPNWKGGRAIQVTLWLELGGRTYFVRLRLSTIQIAM